MIENLFYSLKLFFAAIISLIDVNTYTVTIAVVFLGMIGLAFLASSLWKR